MKIINFEEAKARRYVREKNAEHMQEPDNGIMELQRQYREMAQFYDHWYDEHVVGQDKNGGWIYK